MFLKKTIVMFSCRNDVWFFSSVDVLYFDGTFKSPLKIFYEIFTIDGLTMCNLHFSYRPINVLRRCIQTNGIRGCKTWCKMFFPTIVYADFETAIHVAVAIMWPGFEGKACFFSV
jgi:hypothetical protein